MEFLSQFAGQMRTLWEGWSPAQRTGMLAAVAVCVLGVTGVGFWATTPEYVPLADRLSPQDAAEVISTLEAANIGYRLNYSGSGVSVPKASLSRARLALKDVLATSAAESDDMSTGLWADPSLNHVRQQRQLEQRLARSITQMRSVRSATVHITQPEATPFVRDRVPAKASVILDLQPNSSFTPSDARSIVSLVAHSVEKLSLENVTVLDTEGRMLSSARGIESDVAGQLDYRTRLEADLAGKAETMLMQMLGPGRAVVRVTADVDFTELQRTQTTYDPDTKVKIREDIRSESLSGAVAGASGPVGAAANVNPLAFQSSANNANNSRKFEENSTEYANAGTVDSVRELPGRIRRLTVAAVVQLDDPAQTDAGNAVAGLSKDQIESIIKQAVGFDAARQDAIEVVAAPLSGWGEAAPLPVGLAGWQQYESLIRMASLGIAAVVALILGVLLIRRMKPVVIASETRTSAPVDLAHRAAELSQQAKAHPDAVVAVLRAWLDLPEESAPRQRSAA